MKTSVYLIGQAIGRGRKQGDFDQLSVDFQQTFSSTHEQVVDFDAFLLEGSREFQDHGFQGQAMNSRWKIFDPLTDD